MHSVALALTAIALLIPVAPAFADPGAPGLDHPSSAVYGNSVEQPVLGEEESGGGGQPPLEGDVAGTAEESASFDESLPFTGFSAALVLGAGLAALGLGLTLQAATRRLQRP